MLRAVELKMGKPFVEKEIVPIIQAQRESNCARGLPSVKKEGIRDARVAIVGYGPSLEESLEQLERRRNEFDAIWTVSKAHDYVIERGIVPTHHTDTDYRVHKVAYNKLWQEKTRYFMATQVHPTYLDALAGRNVSLFHVVQPEGGTFDVRYFKQPVAFDAGLQAAQLAFELGYRNQDWYGIDGSARGKQTHVGPHEGIKPEPLELEIDGYPWQMNQFLVRQCLFCEEVLRKIPRMKVTIWGDGALRPFLLERKRCQFA